MNSLFTEELLADKLLKLNSSQQCIETLSHWCIFHRSKAERVVTTWDKQFHSLEMRQKVPLLYLANDILQNSKRKGNEFVTEFWKVLPSALKEVVEKGDDRGKNVVARLLEIWEERKVFGSHPRNLKDVMLGEELPTPLDFKRKRSRAVKIIKRDTRSIKTKLTVGGMAERIVTAFHLVLSDNNNEDEEMNKCKYAVSRVRNIEEDVDMALSRAKDPKRKSLSNELQAEENILKQSIEKLKVVAANRTTLVSQLRDALNEEESDLENVHTQIQVAEAQLWELSNKRKLLDDENYVGDSKNASIRPSPSSNSTAKSGQGTGKSTKSIAAEVADMLTASSSSQYIMTSVLSTFAAEEAKTAHLTKSSSAPNSLSSLPPTSSAAKNSVLQPERTSIPSTMQTQIPNSQPQYLPLTNANATPQQYLQPSSAIMTSYGYAAFPPLPTVPPPHIPPPSYSMSPLPLVPPQIHSSMQISQQQQQQQQPLTMNSQSTQFNQFHLAPLPPQLPPPPGGPSFRPVTLNQAPGMVYYAAPPPPPHPLQ